jgi:pimeloyl-ACP methyl ester carboxylesterase
MPEFSASGARLYYEVTGNGFPLVWSHEFARDYRSWDPQVKFFARRYRVITYNAWGYPPSDVPPNPEDYSQEQAVDDLRLLLEHLGIEQAYLGGLSMGGNVVLNFGLAYPHLAKALIVAATGAGTTNREKFLQDGEKLAARRLLDAGMEAVAHDYALGPTRTQFLRKDPKGWEEFHQGLAGHSALGSALTYRGVQMKRPTIYALENKLRQLQVPTLILIGDEDEPCVEPAVFMKRCIPRPGLAVFPQSGHAINLEGPDQFNRTVLEFLTTVENGGWTERMGG